MKGRWTRPRASIVSHGERYDPLDTLIARVDRRGGDEGTTPA